MKAVCFNFPTRDLIYISSYSSFIKHIRDVSLPVFLIVVQEYHCESYGIYVPSKNDIGFF